MKQHSQHVSVVKELFWTWPDPTHFWRARESIGEYEVEYEVDTRGSWTLRSNDGSRLEFYDSGKAAAKGDPQ